MHLSPRRQFTLVELITVIVIIMILMGILLPTVSIVIRKAEVNQTKVRMKTLIMAIKQYESQYGVLPEAGSSTDSEGDHKITEGTADYTTMIGLLTNVSTGNVRGIRFLEPIDPTDPNNYVDAWQQQFRVKLDTNYDGQLNGDGVPGIASTSEIYTNISVVSFGPDENLATDDDNVRSWDD